MDDEGSKGSGKGYMTGIGSSSAASAAAKAAMAGIPAGALDALKGATRHLSAVEEAMRPYRDLDDTMKRLTGIAGGRSAFEAITANLDASRKAFDAFRVPDHISKLAAGGLPDDVVGAASRAAGSFSAIQDAMRPFNEINDRMKHLTEAVGGHSAIGKVAQQIAEQQRAIDALRVSDRLANITPAEPERIHIPPFRMPELPPNPIHETNDRLERIEQRFEQMLDVAANGAEIATGLQAHAAEFLVKFENAASDNDRSAARAIRLGAIAVLIAVAMPIVQIAYTELWRVPQDSASMKTVITDMQTEIATLRQTQIEAADRIAAALERSDQHMVEALRDVARSLAAPPPVPVEEPASVE